MSDIEIKIKSKTENISFARNCVANYILDTNPTISYINEIKTIVSEAVTNSIVHGYNNKNDNDIIIRLNKEKELLKIEIEDYGKGIKDIEKCREPMFTTLEDEERAGLGFTIMEVFSDDINITSLMNKGTKITFQKILNTNKELKNVG